jgi:hypothetical protein
MRYINLASFFAVAMAAVSLVAKTKFGMMGFYGG